MHNHYLTGIYCTYSDRILIIDGNKSLSDVSPQYTSSNIYDDNKIVKEYGEIPEFDFEPLNHVDLIEKIDGADMKVEAAKEVPMVRTDKAR